MKGDRRIIAWLYQQAREDGEAVIKLINDLEEAGEIEKGDLDRFRRMAERWIRISENNRKVEGSDKK